MSRLFLRGSFGAAIVSWGFGSKLPGKTTVHGAGRLRNSRGAADMDVPTRLPGYATRQSGTLTSLLRNCGAPGRIPTKPGLTAAANGGSGAAGNEALYVVGANPLAHFARRVWGAAHQSC